MRLPGGGRKKWEDNISIRPCPCGHIITCTCDPGIGGCTCKPGCRCSDCGTGTNRK